MLWGRHVGRVDVFCDVWCGEVRGELAWDIHKKFLLAIRLHLTIDRQDLPLG